MGGGLEEEEMWIQGKGRDMEGAVGWGIEEEVGIQIYWQHDS